MPRRSGGVIPWLVVAALAPAWAVGGTAAVAPDDLRACADASLQARLEQELSRLSLDEAVARRHLAVALVDLSSPESPRLAMVNGDDMMDAASLPKIAILLGAFCKRSAGSSSSTKRRSSL